MPSPTCRFAPRGDAVEPLRSRWATITGPDVLGSAVVTVDLHHGVVHVHPRMPAQREQEPRGDGVELADVPERERPQERPQRLGAYARANNRPIPPWRSTAISWTESAPATIPPTSEATFNPAFAPLSLGTDRCSSASSRSPARSASASTGTSPADDTRFGSSNTVDVRPRL